MPSSAPSSPGQAAGYVTPLHIAPPEGLARPGGAGHLGPVFCALVFGSVVCLAMLGTRMVLTNAEDFGGLAFNLFLAWIPMVLSLVLQRLGREPGRRGLFWFLGLVWMLFYPNSFYVVTDLLHLTIFGATGVPQWFDMIMTVSFAFNGLFLGSLSLYLLHSLVGEKRGRALGWTFAAAMLAVASLGIYLGRYMRWNSWEMITHPAKLAGQARRLVEVAPSMGAFSLMFFVFSLMVYVFVVGLAQLHEREA